MYKVAAVPPRAIHDNHVQVDHTELHNMQHNNCDYQLHHDDDAESELTHESQIETHMVQEHRNSDSQSNHSYVIDYLGQYDDTGSDETKQYWPPATEEEALKDQLKTLKVDEIPRDSIKY